jgi:uncharacterized protein
MPSAVDFVSSVVKTLVDKPDQVEARWVDNPDGGFVELKVSPEERGKVIGKRGRTIQSLRQLATAAFGKGGRVGVEVAE